MSDLNDLQLHILEKHRIECVDTVRLLGDLVDGELTPTLATRLGKHIRGCSYCKELESSYRDNIGLAKTLNDDQPIPIEVQNRLRISLNQRLGLNLPLVANDG